MAENAVIPVQPLPARERAAPRWPLLTLRVLATLYALATIAQPFLAGLFLSGDFGALKAHEMTGQAVGLFGIITLIVAILYWRVGRGGPLAVRFAAGLAVAVTLQIFMGYGRVLALHVPLGVALVFGVVRLAVYAWRGAER